MRHGTRRAGTLVVGAGQAGISLVTALRELGDTEPVVLVGDEPERALRAPPAVEELPARRARPRLARLPRRRLVRRPRRRARHRRRRRRRSSATPGRPRRHRLGPRARLRPPRPDHGRRQPGAARRRRRPRPASTRVRTLADADRLAPRAPRGTRGRRRRAAASSGSRSPPSARALGAAVTVVEAADRLLGRAVTPLLSDAVRGAHERRGTRVLLGASAVAPHRRGRAAPTGVELADGAMLRRRRRRRRHRGRPAHRPRRRSSGSTSSRAASSSTSTPAPPTGSPSRPATAPSDPTPSSAGWPGRPGSRAWRTRPTRHARLRRPSPATRRHTPRVPWFWSDQGDLRLQIAGLPHGADQTVVRGDAAAERFSLLSYRGRAAHRHRVGRASPTDYLAVKRALEKGMTIPADAAADSSVPLKRLITRARDTRSS